MYKGSWVPHKAEAIKCVSLKTIYTVVNVKDTTQRGKVVRADKTLSDAVSGCSCRTRLGPQNIILPWTCTCSVVLGRHSQLFATYELGKFLEEGVCSETLPSTELKTCTIIDDHALVQATGKPARANTFGDLSDAFSEFLSDQILIKAKDTLQTGELITAGGFADETTAEASHGSDVSLLETSQEETNTRQVSLSIRVWTFGHIVQRTRCVGVLGSLCALIVSRSEM